MKITGHNQTLFNPEAIRREIMRRLFIYGAIALVVFLMIFLIIGLVLFPFISTSLLPDGPAETDWSLLEGVISLITLSLFVGGGVFVFLEYVNNEVQQRREFAESSFNIYKDIFDRMTDPEETASRRWIIINIPPLDDMERQTDAEWLADVQAKLFARPEDWTDVMPPGQVHLKRILNTFDFLGFVAEHYWHMEEDLVEWLSPPIAKVWERIGPYVEHEAEQRNEPDYYQSAREFGSYCLAWRRNRFGTSVILDQGV